MQTRSVASVLAALLAVPALSVMGTAAHAEDYHAHSAPTVSAKSRAAVQAEAVAAAHAPDQNISSSSVVLAPPAAPRERAAVRAEAMRTAHAPDQNLHAGSRVDSTIVSTLPNPMDAPLQQTAGAARADIR